jgi:hypothetical protein
LKYPDIDQEIFLLNLITQFKTLFTLKITLSYTQSFNNLCNYVLNKLIFLKELSISKAKQTKFSDFNLLLDLLKDKLLLINKVHLAIDVSKYHEEIADCLKERK